MPTGIGARAAQAFALNARRRANTSRNTSSTNVSRPNFTSSSVMAITTKSGGVATHEAVLHQLGAYSSSNVALTPTALRRIFRFLDPDSSGTLSREEFFHGLELLGLLRHGSDRIRAMEILADIDVDNSGDVSGESFSLCVLSPYK